MDFKTARMEKTKKIEQVLRVYLPEKTGYQERIMDAMEYSLLAGGKRLRPMLMQETYEIFGSKSKAIGVYMAAIEMIHTYSLVHDDLPAMDNDDYRRGRKTTHAEYGEAMGILAGDGLLNYAFETAAKAFSLEPDNSVRLGHAMQILATKSGVFGMIGGQVVDVEKAGGQVSKEVLDFIYELKTGALIESSMMIGAILGGANEKEVSVIEKIAKNVGLAFQIQDDILDVTSTEEVLGKPIHSDEKNEKTTYVTLEGLEKAKKDVKQISEEAIMLLRGLNREAPYLEWLLEELIDRKN